MSKEAMKQALEALESDPITHAGLVNRKQAIAVLRQALEEKQEPVLWLKTWSDGSLSVLKTKSRAFSDHELEPLYAAPPKREWVGLTDEDISYFRYQATFCDELDTAFMAELIEKDLKEKNHG